MDIQQLMPLAAPSAKTSTNRGGDSVSAGGFAAELAQVASAGKNGAPSLPARTSLAGDGVALDDIALGELRQAFVHADMATLAEWLGDAGVAQGDMEAMLKELKALLQPPGNEAPTVLPAELRQEASNTENLQHPASNTEHDEWSALRERLALIDQAGRMAEPEPAETGQASIAPWVPIITQGENSQDSNMPKARQGVTDTSRQDASSRALLQSAILDTMQRAGQARADEGLTPRLTSAETWGAPHSRQAEVSMGSLQASQADGSRASLLDGLSPLSGNAPPSGQAAAAGSSGSTVTTGSLSAPVNSPAWPQQLGQQLVRMSQSGGEQRVELQLHPADLGPLSVSLKLGEQGAQAQFLSAHAQVRQVLEQALPQLREALAEQGIELGEATVSEQRTGGGNGGEAGDGSQPLMAGGALGEGGEPDLGVPEGASGREISLEGRVDLYA